MTDIGTGPGTDIETDTNTATDTDTDTATDTTGILDEALERLHTRGPERQGRLTNHAPMAVEALAARGRPEAVHKWLDLYAPKLEEFPAGVEPVTDADWRAALGDPRRAADWIAYFGRELGAHPWREVLARWWPRLLPGMYGGSTHPVIRVGHAVRTLEAGGATAPASPSSRTASATGPPGTTRHRPRRAAGRRERGRRPGRGAALADRTDGGFPARLGRVRALPVWAASVDGPEEARRRLTELVRAATHRYATHGHGDEVMLVHAATAPNAVLRALPVLPRALWVPSLRAAWTASAAVTAMYAPDAPVACDPPGSFTAEEVFERALAHGDEHVIKLTDTALDVGDEQALAAALRAIELGEPLR